MKHKTPEKTDGARILLVDDRPDNLRLLAEMLTERGYIVQIARSGDLALRVARARLPDIVLLDINMPGTDGFEVCRQLKADPSTREVPVIFVTALAKTEEKVHGLELGGVDYVTKPFQVEEMVARLETQLELKRLRDALAAKVADLEDRNGRLNLFSRALAHDLRGPLSAVMGFGDLLVASSDLPEAEREYAEFIRQSSQKMNDIIDSLLLLIMTGQPNQQLTMIGVENAYCKSVAALAEQIEGSGACLRLASELPEARGNVGWVERVWTNLISNGIKYGGEPPVITIGSNPVPGGGQIRYWVEDNGAGLSDGQMEKLFTAFSRLEPGKAEGIGLGLVIVQKIVEQMGGEVGVERGQSGATRFFFTLPVSAEGGTSDPRTPADGVNGDEVILAS